MTLVDKLQNVVNTECDYAEKKGSSRFSVCDHYNWDRDLWNHRDAIVAAIRRRGYKVSISCRWGVTDIDTTKLIVLD